METPDEKQKRIIEAWHAMQNFLSFLTADEFYMIRRMVKSIEKMLFKKEQ